MLGLDDYGSGSESESEHENPNVSRPQLVPNPSSDSLPIKSTTKRAPKKITIGLPVLLKDEDEEKDDLELEKPALKRQKKMSGAGVSSLLSMLPAPQQVPHRQQQEEQQRVLGGGKGPGLVFDSESSVPASKTKQEEGEEEELTMSPVSNGGSSLPFLPPSLVKGKANVSLEDSPKKKVPMKPAYPTASAVDFFSIDDSKTTIKSASTSTSTFSIPTLSPAPSIPTFEHPEPTPQDPYPGYYQLPSGQWAAYEPEYYEKFRRKWQSDYDAYVRDLEKGAQKGFEGYEENVSEVDAMKEMQKAKIEIKEREERKALTKGATGPAAEPNMTLTASKRSGIAKSRHQLATLLADAYANREALEEKIAEGRRNRKEAGNKYGF